jgi:hypothetical protein
MIRLVGPFPRALARRPAADRIARVAVTVPPG